MHFVFFFFFFFQAEDGIRDVAVTGVQTCALPISSSRHLADGDERLTDPPGEQPLQPEQRYQRFVPAQRSGGNEPAAQHATGDPPSRHAGQVEILEMTEAEPSRLELL